MVHIIGSARPAMRRLREGADYEEAELIKLYMLGVIGVGLGFLSFFFHRHISAH